MSQDMTRNGQRLSKYQLGRGDVQIWLDLDSFSEQNPGKGRGPLVPMDITHVYQGSLQRVLDGLVVSLNQPVGLGEIDGGVVDFYTQVLLEAAKEVAGQVGTPITSADRR